jgi:hypothetical protein
MPKGSRKGVILFVVLGTIIVVATLSTVILRIMLSQTRLTHHQVSRIQAQYAAKAGVNYALEMLRTNDADWPATGEYTRIMRRSGSTSPDFDEPNLPGSIDRVEITVYDPSSDPGPSGTRKVSAKAIYTYTP